MMLTSGAMTNRLDKLEAKGLISREHSKEDRSEERREGKMLIVFYLVHKKYDMKLGEFDVLATLRRSGKPYRLTPSELIGSMMLTSGAMTNRLDKLEAKGLISREHSKEDRRSVSVQLTKDGLILIDQMMIEHVEMQKKLVKSMSASQKKNTNQLLKTWLSAYE